ncbi:MAG: hypothetical protein ACHQWU_05805 [Gemmatimonadales bacterium]|jgi:hypothetical protein
MDTRQSQWSLRRPLLLAAFAAGVAFLPAAAHGQRSQRGQPRTPFSAADFAKLRWLEGSWQGAAPGEDTVYSRYHFSSDSTIDITYYRDRAMTRPSGNGRIYLTVGRVYQTFGPGRWGATHVDGSGVYFIPQVDAHNTFAWAYESRDAWTATVRTGMSGQDRVTVYHMQRIGG